MYKSGSLANDFCHKQMYNSYCKLFPAFRFIRNGGGCKPKILNTISGVSANTALRLGYYSGNYAKFWLGLQDDFDIEELKNDKKLILKRFEILRNL